MERLSYITRRFVDPVSGDTLDIEFSRPPSKLCCARLRDIGFCYCSKIRSWRGHRHFDEALEIAEEAKKKAKTSKKIGTTICWECDNCYGGCSWSRSFKPVEGWQAVENHTTVKNGKYIEERTSYTVLKCPEFTRDRPRRKKSGIKPVR